MTPISPITKNSGFTLLELLLAITIGAVVLSAVYTTFTMALDSQRRIERVSDRAQAQRFFAERLRADLKNLLAEVEALSGSDKNLVLQVVLPDQGSYGGLREIHYQFQTTAAGGQIRRQITTADHDFDTIVYDDVDALSFRYLIDGHWRTSSEQDSLPQAVECTVSGSDWQQQITVSIEVEHVSEPS